MRFMYIVVKITHRVIAFTFHYRVRDNCRVYTSQPDAIGRRERVNRSTMAMKTKRLKVESRNRGITCVPVKRNTIGDYDDCSRDFFDCPIAKSRYESSIFGQKAGVVDRSP